MPAILFHLLVSCLALVLGCHAHPRPSNALLEEQQQMLRWGKDLPQLDIFSGEDSRLGEDSDAASLSSEEQQQLLEGPSKRRDHSMSNSRGPTLSVVSPLEVLRQRLRLDRAKQLFRDNQRQIVANEQLLEKIGKRMLRP